MMKYGLPTQLYVDNGKIYSSIIWMPSAEARHHAVAEPSISTGWKRQNRTSVRHHPKQLPAGIPRVAEKESLSLAELNEYLWVWLDKYYHERVHSATKQTPGCVLKHAAILCVQRP